MVDLESGLTYMLRHELAKYKAVRGEELFFLKQWLRVLSEVSSANERDALNGFSEY
jgi:hypothetical protein